MGASAMFEKICYGAVAAVFLLVSAFGFGYAIWAAVSTLLDGAGWASWRLAGEAFVFGLLALLGVCFIWLIYRLHRKISDKIHRSDVL